MVFNAPSTSLSVCECECVCVCVCVCVCCGGKATSLMGSEQLDGELEIQGGVEQNIEV